MLTDVAVAAASFPVVFFDGEREIDIGAVAVDRAMSFKKFQAVISQKIGIAPHQISTSLVRRKKARSSPEIRRRVPIDDSSDFAALVRERDCFVLAVLRRARRGGRGRRGGRPPPPPVAPPELTILQRNPDGGRYEAQMKELERQRELYMMSCYPAAVESAPPREATPAGVCGECTAAREGGRATGFHWCVYDAVTVGFRSPVGPIQRPQKKHVEAS